MTHVLDRGRRVFNLLKKTLCLPEPAKSEMDKGARPVCMRPCELEVERFYIAVESVDPFERLAIFGFLSQRVGGSVGECGSSSGIFDAIEYLQWLVEPREPAMPSPKRRRASSAVAARSKCVGD